MKSVLEQLPRVKIRDFVRAGAFVGKESTGAFEMPGCSTVVTFRADMEAMTIQFTATGPDGNQVVSELGLISQPTNLGIGTMWLFYSFRSKTRCRVLYLVRGCFVGRMDIIDPRYKQQLQGRAERMWLRYGRPSPARPNGKPTYRGKLTPYGKRLARYDELGRDLDADVALYLIRRFKLWQDMPDLLPAKDMNY